MLTIALCNQKGGVGKSTTTFHLARAAVLAGLRVLVIDMDPQGNITDALTNEPLPEDLPGVADALSNRSIETLSSVLVPTIWTTARLAPTVGESLAVVRDELVISGPGREARLQASLAEIADVDLVLIDCPPSLDQLTINALTAANRVLVVSQSKQWSATGLAHLLETIRAVQTHYNADLRVQGIIVNQHDARTLSGSHWHKELVSAAQQHSIPMFDPPVPKRVIISDTVEASMGLDEYPGDNDHLLAIYSGYVQEVTA